MVTSPEQIDSTLVEELLGLSTVTEQTTYLQAAGLFDEFGLSQLLGLAMRLARSDPGKAHALTSFCATAAELAGTPALVPRARYIQAQTHAITGELNQSLTLIEAAHDGYLALGDKLQAIRTRVGLMHVLNELGRHQQALDVGQSILQQLKEQAWDTAAAEAETIAAFAHNNCGVCYRRMGRYEEALQAYAAAEAGYLRHQLTERLGDIRNNRGLILLHLGRTQEALTAFETAAAVYAEAGLTLVHALCLSNIGEAHLLLGHYTRSLTALAEARHLFASLDKPPNEHIFLLEGQVYLALNLYPEALRAYRELARRCRETGMTHYRALALWGMGSALTAQNQFEEAAAALVEAGALFEAAGHTPMLCTVMLEQSALQLARGQRDTAVSLARRALALLEKQEARPVEAIYAHLRLADLHLPDLAAAETHLMAAQELAQTLALPHLRYRLQQRLGHLRRRQQRDDEAQQLLETAVAEIERLRGNVAQEAMRVSFLTDKITAYEELLQLYLDRSDGDENDLRRAFGLAEQAKSRALIDLLTGVIDPRDGQPMDSAAAARLETLQADLNAVYNEFLGGTTEQERQANRPELKARAQELEKAIHEMRLPTAVPGATPDLFTMRPPSAKMQSQPEQGQTLLAYHIIGEEILAFVQTGEHMAVARHLSTVTAVKQLVQRWTIQLERFRAGQSFVRRHMAVLEQSAQRVLAALYQELVAPLEALLVQPGPGAPLPKVAIVPHGLLHQAPFHALYDGQQYLLEKWEISYGPSAAVLALCQQQERRPVMEGALFAVPDPLIPDVRGEVAAVATHLPAATTYLDGQATIAMLKEKAAEADVLHLACHGLFRADNPIFSALKLSDGWLTAADVLQLNLREGALVTLSACESGRSQVLSGDELIGLTRGFLGAGAATLVVSLWLVQDDTTAVLMADWYRRLRQSDNRAAALRAAQLALKQEYAHPYYWAPFVLIGQN